MKTQNPNVHQYLKVILSLRISGDLMSTKYRINFISLMRIIRIFTTYVHIPTVFKWAFSESANAGLAWLQYQHYKFLVMWYELSVILTSIVLIKLL